MKLLLEPTRRCSTPYGNENLMSAWIGVILLIQYSACFYSNVSFNDLCWVQEKWDTHENVME